jgi:hypothetical protein
MKLSIYRSIIRTKRDAILLGSLGLCAFVWFFSYYSHNQDIILRSSFEIKNLETQQLPLAKTKILQEKLEQTTKDLKLKLRNSSHNSSATNLKQPSHNMTDFANKACKAGLRLDSCTIKKHTDKTWFMQHTIIYELTGSDEQINAFIKEIRGSDQPVRCTALTIKKMDTQTSHIICTLRFLTFKDKTQINSPLRKAVVYSQNTALPQASAH